MKRPEIAKSCWNSVQRRIFQMSLVPAAAGLLLLSACGGGQAPPAVTAAQEGPQAAQTVSSPAAAASREAPLQMPALAAMGNDDPGLLLLLVPNDYTPGDARVAGWIDAGIELGLRVTPITDSEFAALGARALKFAGLVLPDDFHSIASDALLDSIKAYAASGGNVMLTFDFGALTLRDDGAPVYPIPKSRLSDLAGVDYVLYDELRDRTTGLGPVTATRSMLRLLQVPPGKSLPYSDVSATVSLTDSTQAVAESTEASSTTARFLPVSAADPGGVRGYDPQQFQNVRTFSLRERRLGTISKKLTINYGSAIKAEPPVPVTSNRPISIPLELQPDALTDTISTAALTGDTLEAYSGYLYGHLVYPTYVTRGTFDGQTIATSPQFGLVAGTRSFGAGKVLFVNLPLTYLKGRTDALPLHGFLGYFGYEMLKLPRIASMPSNFPGLVLNWHLDSMEAQAPTLALEKAGVFKKGPYSIHMTAGPDVEEPGDGGGWNLDNNQVAKDYLVRMRNLGHSIGNHGGWNHDYYGLNATEFNADVFLPYLVWNKSSVEAAIGRPTREYSSPEGNNPNWAMSWLESNGIVGAYFGGHTGLGVTRQYRDGMLKTPNLWVVPVTPQGLYATFEEFQDFGVPKAEVIAWYHDLIDFAVQYRTNRMIYMHPPGAHVWQDVLLDMLAYAGTRGKWNFRWYTMERLADFSAKRQNVQWSQTLLADGSTRFDASHPLGLAEVAWRLPKTRYQKPVVSNKAAAVVRDDGSCWVVSATGVTSLQFTAKGI